MAPRLLWVSCWGWLVIFRRRGRAASGKPVFHGCDGSTTCSLLLVLYYLSVVVKARSPPPPNRGESAKWCRGESAWKTPLNHSVLWINIAAGSPRGALQRLRHLSPIRWRSKGCLRRSLRRERVLRAIPRVKTAASEGWRVSKVRGSVPPWPSRSSARARRS